MFNFQRLKQNISNFAKKIVEEQPIDEKIIDCKKKLNSLKKKLEFCDEEFKETFAYKFNKYYSYNKPLILLIFCKYSIKIIDAPNLKLRMDLINLLLRIFYQNLIIKIISMLYKKHCIYKKERSCGFFEMENKIRFVLNGQPINPNTQSSYIFFYNSFLSDIKENLFSFDVDKISIFVLQQERFFISNGSNIKLLFRILNCEQEFSDYEILFEELIDPFLQIVKNQKKTKQITDFKEIYECLNEQEKLGEIDSWYYDIDQLVDINTSLNQFNFQLTITKKIMNLEPKHLIRFSIDIISIKNNRFYGKIYVMCKENKKLNKKQFRTQPLLDLVKINSSEQDFKNGFFTFERKYEKEELFDLLENESFQFDIYHQDRNKNQVNIAKVQANLQPLKKLPFKKTQFSVVKLYDAFHKIEDIDLSSEGKKIGELRLKIYLEDLGTNEEEYFEQNLLQQIQQEKNNIQSQYQSQEEFTLEELEMKIVWELETWKKSEEQKFLLLMKKKELEMMNELQQKMSQKQKEQQKAFNNYEAKLFQIEQQLRAKSADLQRREFQIKNFENMMKEKVKLFAEESLKIKKEINFTKTKFEDQIKELKIKSTQKSKQVVQLEKKIQQKDILIQNLKDQIKDSPITPLKQELDQKKLEVQNLEQDIDKYIQLKKEFQIFIKDQQIEIDRLKKDNQILQSFQLLNKRQENQKTQNVFKEIQSELKQFQIHQSLHQNENVNKELKHLIQQREDFLLLGLKQNDFAIQEIDSEIKKIKESIVIK